MKSLTHTMNDKGQITIPSQIRKKLQLFAGSKVEFIINGEVCMIIPTNKSLASLKGFLPKPNKALSISELKNIIKGSYDDWS